MNNSALNSNKNSQRIDTLTSLRFFAAMMVVCMHTNAVMGYSSFLTRFSFCHGVSLFFVLSGFIMTYVYQELPQKNILKFFKSRFARLWPAHVAALLLLILVIPDRCLQFWGNRYNFLISLFMIGSWIPITRFYAIVNVPSWSIGTECFFYLCFPFLIYHFSKNWYIKLLAAICLTISIILICKFLAIPVEGDSVNVMSLVYISPLCRLVEFVLGMCTGLLFIKISKIVRLPFVIATALEAFSIYFVYMALSQSSGWYYSIFGYGAPGSIPTPGALWISWSSGSCISFALLILILAFQKGMISKILALPIFILLGEISYSLYLIHYTFVSYYGIYRDWFNAHFSPVQTLILFLLITLPLSYLIWRFIEVPCRRIIVNFSWPFFTRKQAAVSL